MSRETTRRLERLLEALREDEKNDLGNIKALLRAYGLSESEADSWLKNEPNFKRDVTKSYQNQP